MYIIQKVQNILMQTLTEQDHICIYIYIYEQKQFVLMYRKLHNIQQKNKTRKKTYDTALATMFVA